MAGNPQENNNTNENPQNNEVRNPDVMHEDENVVNRNDNNNNIAGAQQQGGNQQGNNDQVKKEEIQKEVEPPKKEEEAKKEEQPAKGEAEAEKKEEDAKEEMLQAEEKKEKEAFDLNRLMNNVELRNRLVTPIDKDGNMGSVFFGDNTFEKQKPEEAMEQLRSLASQGKLYLRDRASGDVRKIESEKGGYQLGERFTPKHERPYGPILSVLLRLTDRYFKGVFGLKWFSTMADRYRAYLAKESAWQDEVYEDIKSGAISFPTDEDLGELDPQEVSMEGKEKEKEKEPVSIQQPKEKINEKKKVALTELEKEREAWLGTNNWKKRVGDALFRSEGMTAEKEAFAEKVKDGNPGAARDYLVGHLVGVFGRGAEANGGKKNHDAMLRAVHDGSGIDEKNRAFLAEGAKAFREAQAKYDVGEKGPMEKLMHDAIVDIAKSASDGDRLSDRHKVIGDNIKNMMDYIQEHGLDVKFSPKENEIIRGASEMGKIATKGAQARQALAQKDPINVNDPATREQIISYMNMKGIDAALGKNTRIDIDGVALTQMTLGNEDQSIFSMESREKALANDPRVIAELAKPDAAKMVREIVNNPFKTRAMKIGNSAGSICSDIALKQKNAKKNPPQTQLVNNKEKILENNNNNPPVLGNINH